MSRRHRAVIRETIPDPVYNDRVVSRFINSMMWKGKKSVAEKIFYDAMGVIKSKTQEESITVFHKAVDNVKPILEVKSRRVGGATYQVPVDVRPNRQIALSLRWIIGAARTRAGKAMSEKLAYELIDASKNVGEAIKKKENVHRMAEANRAFAHYKW